MQPLSGFLRQVRAARIRLPVGKLDRTLVVVESEELLAGQKRGIAKALRKAKEELTKLQERATARRIRRDALTARVAKALRREHLAAFVSTVVGGTDDSPTLEWHVDATKRRALEQARLGKRVVCTDSDDDGARQDRDDAGPSDHGTDGPASDLDAGARHHTLAKASDRDLRARALGTYTSFR
jgi:hypothetical protein